MIKRVTRQMAGELYSFHDCVVTRIEVGDGKLALFFAEGFLEAPEVPGGPVRRVFGRVEFEDIDPDFCDVTLLKADKKGKLSGKRIELKKFLKKYEGSSFEIVEASYGFNTAKFEGELFKKDRIYAGQQILLSVYYFGDMVYLVDEKDAPPALREEEAGKAAKPEDADKSGKTDKPEDAGKSGKTDKPEDTDKSGKDKADKSDKSDKGDKSGKPDKGDKSDKKDKSKKKK